VSRLPRFQEHLKTGFAAEAKSAAQYRAFAERAKRDGLGKLAAKWSELAAEKDRLAENRKTSRWHSPRTTTKTRFSIPR